MAFDASSAGYPSQAEHDALASTVDTLIAAQESTAHSVDALLEGHRALRARLRTLHRVVHVLVAATAGLAGLDLGWWLR